MIWVALSILVTTIFIVGNIRVWRTEKIRMKCVDQAIESRSYHGRVYSNAERCDVVLDRAIMYENYVRGIKPKKDDPPPPTSPPRRTE